MSSQDKTITDQQYENLKRNTLVMHKALSTKCVDCNILWHPLVMTFDHVQRESKLKSPSSFRTAPPHIFDEEIAKCEVVCRNCHQIREYLRDKDIMKVGKPKQDAYNYYASLVPYLSGGGLLRKDAFEKVPVAWLV